MPRTGSVVDFGIAYLHIREVSIDNNQAALGRGRVTGNYNNSAWIVGAQYSRAF